MYTKINKHKSYLLFLIIFNCICAVALAQKHPLEAEMTVEYRNFLLSKNAAFSQARLASATNPSKLSTLKTLSISVWIVKDSLRKTHTTNAEIQAAIDVVNINFAPMNLAFKICKFKTIENFQYVNFKKELETDLYTQYHDPNTLNIYLVDTVKSGSRLIAGYTYLPLPAGGRDIMVIDKDELGQLKTTSYLFGLYFGLLPTNEVGVGGAEMVNRTNCSTTGDMICDTEADPYPLPKDGFVDGNCEFISTLKDANNEYYTPPVGNVMSHYSSSCTCGFTPNQFAVMTNIYLQYRSYLY